MAQSSLQIDSGSKIRRSARIEASHTERMEAMRSGSSFDLFDVFGGFVIGRETCEQVFHVVTVLALLESVYQDFACHRGYLLQLQCDSARKQVYPLGSPCQAPSSKKFLGAFPTLWVALCQW